jgi:hypothetical protein
MTGRANEIVAALRRANEQRPLDPSLVARTLRRRGLLPSETGWVLHRVFGVSMPEAVHRATLAAAEGSVRAVRAGKVLPSESLHDEPGPVHFGRD